MDITQPRPGVQVDVATVDDLEWIGALECEYYGSWRAVARERLSEWHGANPNGFLIIREDGRRTGHVTLLPLRRGILRAMANGSRNEGQITAADIFPPQERLSVRDLYLESIIAEPLHLLGAFVSTFARHVSRLGDVRRLRNLYAYPATDAGRLLMSNLGFTPIEPGHGHSKVRSNGRMYRLRFSDLAETTATVRAKLIRRRRDANSARLSL